jgi:hypothetical protein
MNVCSHGIKIEKIYLHSPPNLQLKNIKFAGGSRDQGMKKRTKIFNPGVNAPG